MNRLYLLFLKVCCLLFLMIFCQRGMAFTTCLSASVNGSGTSLDLYWVGHLENGGSGNWSDPCSWRVGGVNGTERPAQGPRPVDNVFFTDLGFTASTSTVEINANAFCASLTMDASFTNTVVFGAAVNGRTLTVGNGSVGGFSLADPSTLDFNYIGQIFFVWDGSHDIELNGNELKCRLNFDNASGVFNFTSGAWLTGFMNAHSPFYLRAGTINTNNFTFDIPSLRVNSAGVINGGTSIFNISGVTNAWGSNPIYSVSNNLDLDDCVFNLSSGVANQRIRTGVNDMGDMNLLGEDVVYAFYHHFTCVGDVELAEKSTFNTSIGGAGATITGDLLLNGSSSIQLSSGGFSVGSLSQGPGVDCGSINTIRGLNTSRILTSSSNVSLHDVLLENVEAGNSASSGGSGSLTYSVSGAVDLGGNSFWDLTTSSAQVLHWTGGAGDSLWSSGGNWDLGCVPGPQDSVVFENMNGEVVNLDVDGYVNSIHWVSDGTSGEFISPSVSALNVYGHFTLNPTMDWDLTSTITFRGGNHTMDFSTQTLNNHLYFQNAEYTLLSDIDNPNGSRQLYLATSTIHAVGRTIDIGRVVAYQSSTINADNTTFNLYDANSWYDWRGELVPNFTNGSVVNFLHSTPRIYGAGHANVLDMPSFTTVAGSLLRVDRSASSSMEVHGDVTLGGGAYFNGTAATHLLMKDITIDGDLSFAGGNTILIAGGTNRTFTVTGDFTATGTGCHTSTFIQTVAGSGQVMFDVQGTTTLDFVTLENLDADGFTSPVASNVNDLGGNDNWTITAGSGGATTFYWRADLTSPTTFSGNWSDPNFWTTTQTNTVGDGTCVPTSADNVVFDNLSHDGTGMTSVALSGSNYCHDFTVSNSNARLTGTGNFYISGSLDADATFHSLGGAFSGNYRFNSTDPAGETISAVNRLQGSIIFDSGDGDWSLASDIETHSHFSFLNGNFNTNGHDMYIRLNVNISGNQVGNLDMSGSTIDVNIWSMNGISNISFVAPELIKVRHWIRPRDLIYNNVESAGTSNFIIYFNTGGVGATFKRVDISTPNSTIFGSNTFDTINYVASAGVTGSHRLEAGKTQTLTSPNGQIFAQGNPSGFLNIRSTVTGTMATIHKDHGTQMCWDYVVLQDLESSEDTDATTATPFIFGGVNNTTTNVTGPLWDFTRGLFSPPTINSGPDHTIICVGQPVDLAFDLGQDGPYDIIYSDGTTNDTIRNIPHGVGTYLHTVYPLGNTTYTVMQVLGNNCNNLVPGTIFDAEQEVTVYPLNDVEVSNDTIICEGEMVEIEATISGSGSLVWDNGLGAAQTHMVSPTSTVEYVATLTDVNNCVQRDTVVVTVNALPAVDAGVDQNLCETNNTVTLSGSGATTYTWDNGVTDGASFTHSVGTVTYTVTGTDANNCVNTDQVVVTVNALPVVDAGLDQTICENNAVTLTGSGATTYTWDNGVTDGTSFTPSAGSVTYTVTGTDANNCSNTDQVVVTVNTLPIVDAGLDQTICENTAVTLAGSGASTYTWDNGVTNGTSFTPSTGTVTYTVTGTDGNNCSNTDQVMVTVNALPTVDAGLDQTICENTTVTLSGSGANTYTWDNGVTDGTSFTPSAGTVTYTVTGTDANNCANTDQVMVTVNTLPVVDAGLDQTICENNAVTLSGSGATTYTWDNGVTDGTSFTPSAGTVTYTVTGTDGNNCTNTDQVMVTVNALPMVDAGLDQTICENSNTITLSGAGANTYTWDNGVTDGASFTQAIGAVTYTVTGTDGNNCSNTDQVVVTVNALPVVDAGLDQTICENNAVTLSGSGATTYTWDNGVTNGTSFTPSAGTVTYTVTGTDGNNCSNTDQVVVTVNALPAVDAGLDQTICENNTVTLSGSGATTYTWDNGVTNGTSFTPSTGMVTYTVTGIDGNNCSNTDQVVVTVNALPAVDAGLDQTICENTAVTLAGSGATTYAWDNGVTDGNSFTPSVGTVTYTVTGTDANNCVNTDQVVVTVNTLPVVDAGLDQTICENNAVTLAGSGATTYTWDNGVTDGTSFTPSAGTVTYTVTGTDGNNCSNTDQVVVTVNTLPTVDAGLDQNFCENSNTVTLSGSGASTYAWDNGVTDGASFTQAIGTVTYTVTGTDGNNCSNTDQVVVTVNALPAVDAGLDQTICENNTVTLAGSGATTYTWDNGVTDGTSFTPSAGTVTYTVTGTDGNNCVNTDQVVVTVNALPVVDAGLDQTICENSAVTLAGSGATTYAWDNGVTNGTSFTPSTGTVTYTVTGTDGNNCSNTDQVMVTVNALPTVDAGLDQTICENTTVTLSGSGANTYTWDNGVTDGTSFTPSAGTVTYTVTGTGANNCANTDQVMVTVNTLPVVDAGLDQTICENNAVTLSGSGATTYTWDNGVTDGTSFTPSAGTVTYTVTGTDGNNCTNTDQVVVTVNALPAVDAGMDQFLCATNNTVNLSGAGAATYTWDNGVTDGVAFTQAVGTVTYTVTGVDANNCSNTDQVVVEVYTQPIVDAGLDQTICENNMVTLAGTGSGGVTYTWDNGVTDGATFSQAVGTVTYTLTGTDGNNCSNTDQVVVIVNALPVVGAGLDQTICENTAVTLAGSGATTYTWDNGVTDGTSFTPSAGTVTYTVTGTDANNCSNTDQVIVTVNALPVVDAGLDQTICENTTVTLTGAGATTYAWDNGVTDGTSFTPSAGTVTYTVTGTDGNSCSNTDQVVVTVNTLPVVDAGLDQTICENNAVTLSGSGATTYTWDNGVTDGTSFTPSAGTVTYTVTGTDGNNCSNTDQVVVIVNALPAVDAGADQTICQNSMVTLAGSGATTYTWDNGVTDGVAFTQAVGTITYTVTGTDGNNCSNTDQVMVEVYTQPFIDAGLDQTICENDTVILSGIGGVTYTWDNGVTDGTGFTPSVGTVTYTVTGTDANNCSNTDQVMVTVNALPVVDAGMDQTICENDTVVLSGAGAISYTWDNGVTDGVGFTPLAGILTYTVTGTDANNCSNTDQVEVTVNELPDVDAGLDLTVCEGDSIVLSGSGANSYQWSNGIVNDVYFIATSGTYIVKGTDLKNCSNFDSVEVIVNAPLVATNDTLVNACIQDEFIDLLTFVDGINYNVEFNSQNTGGGLSGSMVNFNEIDYGTHEYQAVVEAPEGCPNDTVLLQVVLENCAIITVPQMFSPNEDGVNDYLMIDGIDFYPNNELMIFNRWGGIVYETKNYQNNWDGYSISNMTIGNDKLPVGTYFYMLELGDGTEPISGYFQLTR